MLILSAVPLAVESYDILPGFMFEIKVLSFEASFLPEVYGAKQATVSKFSFFIAGNYFLNVYFL